MWYKVKKIYQWSNLVRPKWKPWANTILYLPLKENSNDLSWNWNNGTATNITYSWNKAVFNSSGTSLINLPITNNTFTLNMIAQMTSASGYQLLYRQAKYSSWTWWQDDSGCYLYGYTSIQLRMSQWNTKLTWITADTNEHLYSFVVSANSMKFYIDGVLKTTYNASVGSVSWATFTLGNRYTSSNEWLRWTMREVIVESTLRTDAEILNLAKQFWFA